MSSAGSVSRQRTAPPEVRRGELLAAARKILAAKGYAKMRVSDVVQAAGLSQGTYYLHFTSKQDVVIELARNMISDAMSALRRTVVDDADMEAALKAVLRSYYKVCFEYRDILEATGGGGAAGLDRKRWNEVYAPLNGFARDFIVRWQRRGAIPTDADPDVTSWLFIDTINGALMRLFGHSPGRVSQDYEDQILAWVLSALRHFQGKAGCAPSRRYTHASEIE